jgi:hypothetical protein
LRVFGGIELGIYFFCLKSKIKKKRALVGTAAFHALSNKNKKKIIE